MNPLVATVKDFGSESDRNVEFTASTPALDRHGTVVNPLGINTTNFDANPVFVWGHDAYEFASMDSVIGKVVGHKATEDSFDINVEFAPPSVNPRGEQALRMVRAEYLNMVSIGFYPIRAGFEVIDGNEVYVYQESELLEVSLVTIPANPEAGRKVLHSAQDAVWTNYLKTVPPSHLREADIGAELRAYTRQLSEARGVRALSYSLINKR